MIGKTEIALAGILLLIALLTLGLMSEPVGETDPDSHGPFTASGLAWND